MQITTIGLDLAKNVFQVHGIDAAEKVVVRKQLRRRQMLEFFKALPPCLIGMEACATPHYWAREQTNLGHKGGLMPAKDVKAYVKRNKNDAADAEAICEAVRRPTMRFVRPKSAEQQGRLIVLSQKASVDSFENQIVSEIHAHRRAAMNLESSADSGSRFFVFVEELTGVVGHADPARPLRDYCSGLLALASLNLACRNLVPTFPQRSPPSLLTTAACGGLRSTPDCRPRRAFLHLSYRYAPPGGPALLVTQCHKRSCPLPPSRVVDVA